MYQRIPEDIHFHDDQIPVVSGPDNDLVIQTNQGRRGPYFIKFIPEAETFRTFKVDLRTILSLVTQIAIYEKDDLRFHHGATVWRSYIEQL
jgi:hypothetical protein